MAVRKKFTDSWLKSLPPPNEGRDEYRDTDMPGLLLRVTSKGVKTFSYAYRFGAKTPKMTLGQYPALSIKEARIKLLDVKANGNDIEARQIRETENRT